MNIQSMSMNSESYDGIQNYIHGHIQENKQNESQGSDLGTNAVIIKCQWHRFPSRLWDSSGLSRPSRTAQSPAF